MYVKIIKVGNSYGVRLPKLYLHQHKLVPGQYLHLPEMPGKQGNIAQLARQAQAWVRYEPSTAGVITNIEALVEQQRRLRST